MRAYAARFAKRCARQSMNRTLILHGSSDFITPHHYKVIRKVRRIRRLKCSASPSDERAHGGGPAVLHVGRVRLAAPASHAKLRRKTHCKRADILLLVSRQNKLMGRRWYESCRNTGRGGLRTRPMTRPHPNQGPGLCRPPRTLLPYNQCTQIERLSFRLWRPRIVIKGWRPEGSEKCSDALSFEREAPFLILGPQQPVINSTYSLFAMDTGFRPPKVKDSAPNPGAKKGALPVPRRPQIGDATKNNATNSSAPVKENVDPKEKMEVEEIAERRHTRRKSIAPGEQLSHIFPHARALLPSSSASLRMDRFLFPNRGFDAPFMTKTWSTTPYVHDWCSFIA